MKKVIIKSLVLLGCLNFTVVSFAENALIPSVSTTITAVSEYRFRGLALTRSTAPQASINLSWNNTNAGIWASTLSNQLTGADIEIDLYASHNFQLDKNWSLTLGATAYLFEGGANLDYGEGYTSLGYSANNYAGSLGLAYVPSQQNTSNTDNVYIYTNHNISLPHNFSLSLHGGFEDGAFGNNKLDWSATANYTYQKATFSLGYVDTNRAGNGEAALVGSVSFTF